ncbi:MAG: PEP-CTERM sorting domain-containing protein [Phycisphaerae bacterium]
MTGKTLLRGLVLVAGVGVGAPCMLAETWHEQAILTANDMYRTDCFGWSVSISGDYAIVGAPYESEVAFDAGAAYVFQRTGSVWSQVAKLTASDGAEDDHFGDSVSISGDCAVVGAYSRYINDGPVLIANAGAAYLFQMPATGWADMTETAKLIPAGPVRPQQFGTAVSISGDCAVATGRWTREYPTWIGFPPRPGPTVPGGPATAYVFEKPATGWADMNETAKLTSSDGVVGDDFGCSVSISGDCVIVGASDAADAGAAYVFEKPPTGWADMTETARLAACEPHPLDWFGQSVSISGDCAVVGSGWDDDDGTNTGSAYVFEKPPTGWADMTETAKLTASDRGSWDWFGTSVSIDGDWVAVGAPYDDDIGSASGSGYLFRKPATGWVDRTETIKLAPTSLRADDEFGNCVSISGEHALFGAWKHTVPGSQTGSAYVFTPEPATLLLLAFGALVGMRRRSG